MQIIVQPASFNVESGPLPNILIGGSGMAGLVVNGVTMSGYVPVTGVGNTAVFQQGGTLYISGSDGGGGGNGNITGVQTSSGTVINGNFANSSTSTAANNSVAFGTSALATGTQSFACGASAHALGIYSYAIGDDAAAVGSYSFALGALATAEGYGSFALGPSATSNNTASWVINLNNAPPSTPTDNTPNQWVSYFTGGYYFDGSPITTVGSNINGQLQVSGITINPVLTASVYSGVFTVPTGNQQLILISSSGGVVTAKMPDATQVNGYQYKLKDFVGYAGTHNITITGVYPQTFDGSAKTVMNVAYESFTLVSALGNWYLI